ncbi:MAG: DUF6242 domain-containing protein [Porphyromonas sp.]|nr:DUF6242 domain-containing protein [Porphyromonas sp.]
MKKYNRSVIGALVLLILLSACNKKGSDYTTPVYPDYTFPAQVSVSFPKSPEEDKKEDEDKDGKDDKDDKEEEEKKKPLPDLQFNIDNRLMRIWNQVPLPYQSEYDSVDLHIAVTSEAVVKIINEQTGKTTVYGKKRDKERIDLSGGRAKVVIEMEERPTLTYSLRLQTYGYDPDKFTWQLEEQQLPVAAESAKVFDFNGQKYWLASTQEGEVSLWRFDTLTLNFDRLPSELPSDIDTRSLYTDKAGTVWALTKGGLLMYSKDLLSWTSHETDGVVLTQMVGEATVMSGENLLLATGHAADEPHYCTYKITADGVENVGQVPEGFPVTGGYVYTYSEAGTTSTSIMSGLMADGQPASKSYFLSGSTLWGLIPYQKEESPLPQQGGLFMQTANKTELFVVGGVYAEPQSGTIIKRSVDRGINWSLLPNQAVTNGTFDARHSASGMALGSGDLLRLIVMGGIVNGQAGRDIWVGQLDTTGGIINSFE